MADGLDNRSRDEDGEIHRKRGDTRVGSLRDIYGQGFAPGVRSDERLDTLLRESGQPSLSQYLRQQRKR